MNLEVKLPMLLEIDNQGGVDIAKGRGWHDRTKHMQVRELWLSELQDNDIIKVI